MCSKHFPVAFSGTLEELVEQLTWQQLGRHSKPILDIVDIDGFGNRAGVTHAYARDRVHPADVKRRDPQPKIIPGNERTLYNLHNQLVRQGVEVITEVDHFVHVSKATVPGTRWSRRPAGCAPGSPCRSTARPATSRPTSASPRGWACPRS